MYIGFDLLYYDSIPDLDERLEKINSFLAENMSVNSNHRHFGVFLLTPKNSPDNEMVDFYLRDLQSYSQYRLCIEFFVDKNTRNPDLEIVYDLGKTPELYHYLQTDVAAISYLCGYPENQEVIFVKSQSSISILFYINDNNPDIKRIKNILELLLPNGAAMLE